MTRLTLLIASVGLVAPTGCDVVEPRGDPDVRGEIERHRMTWEDRNFRDYAFTLRRNCFCRPIALGPVRVQVEQGTVVRVADLESGDELGREDWPLFPSIGGVFSTLLDAVDRNADEVEVEWSEALGHPRSVFIDYERSIADEEIGFEVSEVEPRE